MKLKKNTNTREKNQSSSPVINKINALLNDKKHLEWATSISIKEVTFLYDLAAKSQERKDFSPTEKQSKWAIEILNKIDLVKPITL